MKLIDEFRGVQISAPELYEDPAFIAWLNAPEKNQATWHWKGKQPGEYSDLFMLIDHGSGSDEDMPEHCWEKLLAFLKKHGHDPDHDACIVWLTNIKHEEKVNEADQGC